MARKRTPAILAGFVGAAAIAVAMCRMAGLKPADVPPGWVESQRVFVSTASSNLPNEKEDDATESGSDNSDSDNSSSNESDLFDAAITRKGQGKGKGKGRGNGKETGNGKGNRKKMSFTLRDQVK